MAQHFERDPISLSYCGLNETFSINVMLRTAGTGKRSPGLSIKLGEFQHVPAPKTKIYTYKSMQGIPQLYVNI